jgi:ribosomal protein S18 acetylase RimI-like enzyme
MSTDAPTLRPFRPDESGPFWALRLESLQDAPPAFASDYQDEAARPMAEVEGRLRDQGPEAGWVFGAFAGHDPVAMVGLRREQGRKIAHRGFIWGVYVKPAWRKQRLAARLIEMALAAARTMPGLCQVHLEVGVDNAGAKAVYEALGFASHGVIPRALQIDGRFYDDEIMVALL